MSEQQRVTPNSQRPQIVRGRGLFHAHRRSENNYELIFKNFTADIGITVMFNLPRILAENIRDQFNRVIKESEGMYVHRENDPLPIPAEAATDEPTEE